mgnify:FL=1
MILSPLSEAGRYTPLHPRFAAAFEFLRRTELTALPVGRHEIGHEGLFALVEHRQGRTRPEAKLECHRRFIDIQLVLEGVDEMGWRPLSECALPATEYDDTRDIRFFEDTPATWVRTPAGCFCVFFPQDAHAPLVSDGFIRKVVVKIPVGV